VVFADRLEPLARIVARIEEEAIEALDRLTACCEGLAFRRVGS
jgi:hypothetical protein